MKVIASWYEYSLNMKNVLKMGGFSLVIKMKKISLFLTKFQSYQSFDRIWAINTAEKLESSCIF